MQGPVGIAEGAGNSVSSVLCYQIAGNSQHVRG